MLTGAFDETGVSQEWYGMRGGFDIALTMTGTNSVTLQQEMNGTWYTVGSAYTATAKAHISPVDNYYPPARFRLNCATHDTADITYEVGGDILADEVTSLTVSGSLQLEQGDDLLLETGEYWILEQT